MQPDGIRLVDAISGPSFEEFKVKTLQFLTIDRVS